MGNLTREWAWLMGIKLRMWDSPTLLPDGYCVLILAREPVWFGPMDAVPVGVVCDTVCVNPADYGRLQHAINGD